MSMLNSAEFRFYAELNDFLLPEYRQYSQVYRFDGHPAIKNPIEVFGVPHVEVELILVNGLAVKLDYQLKDGDRVSVYPRFKYLDIGDFGKLRESLLTPRFIMDVNLGKLAKRFRALGFDCLYRNDYEDAEVVDIAVNEQRIALTRDRRLLFAKRLEYGYWVRAVDVKYQIIEVLSHFNLYDLIQAFSRCLVCNGVLMPVEKAEVLQYLEPKTKLYYEVFYQCAECQHIYWKGSHIENMQEDFASFLKFNR